MRVQVGLWRKSVRSEDWLSITYSEYVDRVLLEMLTTDKLWMPDCDVLEQPKR